MITKQDIAAEVVVYTHGRDGTEEDGRAFFTSEFLAKEYVDNFNKANGAHDFFDMQFVREAELFIKREQG